ncbi:MAG: AsmA-like C-terminal region-containing protein, partial [Bacteroidota bacterium]
TTATQLPQDVDFRFDAKINELLYDDLVLENFAGMVLVRDGVLRMEGLQFQTLGGLFQTEGTYDPRNPQKPTFDFGLDMIGVDIPKSFQAFTPVQGFLPLAKALVGNFSSKIQLTGDLTQDLTPRLETLSGLGNLRVKDAALGAEKPKFVAGLASFTGLGSKLEGSKLEDVFLKTKFENGTMNIDPTEFKLAGYPAKLSGSTRFDGLLDLNIDIKLPKQEVAGKLNSWFGVGGDAIKDETVDLHLKVTGTHDSPKFGLDREATKAQLTTMLKDQAKEKAQSFLENLVGGGEQKQNQPSDSVQVADSTRTQTPLPDTKKAKGSAKAATEKPKEEVKNKVEDVKNTLKKWGFGRGKGGK